MIREPEHWADKHIVYDIEGRVYNTYDEAGLFMKGYPTRIMAREMIEAYAEDLDEAVLGVHNIK